MSWNVKAKYYLNTTEKNCKTTDELSWTFHGFLKSFKGYFLVLCLALFYIIVKSLPFKIKYTLKPYNKLHCAFYTLYQRSKLFLKTKSTTH